MAHHSACWRDAPQGSWRHITTQPNHWHCAPSMQLPSTARCVRRSGPNHVASQPVGGQPNQLHHSNGPTGSLGGPEIQVSTAPRSQLDGLAACARPSTSGARVTPAKLAALSGVLRLPVKDVQELVSRAPELLQLTEQQLSQHLQLLQSQLGLSGNKARAALKHQPQTFLPRPEVGQLEDVTKLADTAHQLAVALGVSQQDVSSTCASCPSLLKRPVPVVVRQLTGMAAALGGGISLRCMLRLAAQAPQFLTDSPSSMAARLDQFATVMHQPPQVLVNRLRQQPDLLFMSVRLLRNKLSVLSAIFDRPRRLVCSVALACPSLLRTNMNNVRTVYEALPCLVGRNSSWAYAMVCHSPHLLLERVPSLAQQAAHLSKMCRACSSWATQQARLSPAQVADCLGLSTPTYVRLSYLLATGQADSIPLHDALLMSRSAFLARFPEAGGGLAASGDAAVASGAAAATARARRNTNQRGQIPYSHRHVAHPGYRTRPSKPHMAAGSRASQQASAGVRRGRVIGPHKSEPAATDWSAADEEEPASQQTWFGEASWQLPLPDNRQAREREALVRQLEQSCAKYEALVNETAHAGAAQPVELHGPGRPLQSQAQHTGFNLDHLTEPHAPHHSIQEGPQPAVMLVPPTPCVPPWMPPGVHPQWSSSAHESHASEAWRWQGAGHGDGEQQQGPLLIPCLSQAGGVPVLGDGSTPLDHPAARQHSEHTLVTGQLESRGSGVSRAPVTQQSLVPAGGGRKLGPRKKMLQPQLSTSVR